MPPGSVLLAGFQNGAHPASGSGLLTGSGAHLDMPGWDGRLPGSVDMPTVPGARS